MSVDIISGMNTENAGRRTAIGINAHLLTGDQNYRRAGIHNYISQLLRHLALLNSAFEYTVYCNDRQVLKDTGFDFVRTRWPVGRPAGRILWEQLAWPVSVRQRKLDLLHSMAFVTPHMNSTPSVVTVYDLSFIHYPEQFPRLRQKYLATQTRRSCYSARRVVAISKSGRQDIHQLFGIPRQRIDVVTPGVDEVYHPRTPEETAAFRHRKDLPEQYILHVGTLQPRKNIPLLIEAFAELKRPDVALVLVGGKGWFYDEIYERVLALGLKDRVMFPGYVPDAELPLWYNAATLLVFPSIHEGFGMPILEAMACGTPVVAAQTSAIPEVTGDAALLFDPRNRAALSERLAAVLDDSEQAATMRQRGLSQAQNFSWRRAALEMLEVYRKALAIT